MNIKVANTYVTVLDVGTKIKFANERMWYTVQASNVAFSVCTKPLNRIVKLGQYGIKKYGKAYRHEKTVIYTVIDWRDRRRGTENLIFGMGAETCKLCEEMLTRLTSGESEVSYRNYVMVDDPIYEIEKVKFSNA